MTYCKILWHIYNADNKSVLENVTIFKRGNIATNNVLQTLASNTSGLGYAYPSVMPTQYGEVVEDVVVDDVVGIVVPEFVEL